MARRGPPAGDRGERGREGERWWWAPGAWGLCRVGEACGCWEARVLSRARAEMSLAPWGGRGGQMGSGGVLSRSRVELSLAPGGGSGGGGSWCQLGPGGALLQARG